MEIIKPQIDIGLVTAQPENARNFYGNIIGLKQGKSIPLGGGVIQDRFFLGRNVIKINQVPDVKETFKGGMYNAIGIRLLALLIDDLDAIFSRMQEANLKVPEIINFSGVRIAFCKDVDGNLLELVEFNNPQLDDRIQIGLCVKDIQASKDFYGKLLGFKEEAELDMGNGKMRYGFRGGDTLIKFWQADEGINKFSGRHFDKVGLRYFTYQIDDLDACYQYLKENSVPIMQEPTDIGGVAKIMLAADPDENCVEFVEYY